MIEYLPGVVHFDTGLGAEARLEGEAVVAELHPGVDQGVGGEGGQAEVGERGTGLAQAAGIANYFNLDMSLFLDQDIT